MVFFDDDNIGAGKRFLELKYSLDCDGEVKENCIRCGCSMDTVESVGFDTDEGVVVWVVWDCGWNRVVRDRVLGWAEYE